MSLQLSVAVRNARLDAILALIGSSAVVKLRSGAAPADCAAPDSGDTLVTVTLPTSWLAPAMVGSAAKNGDWKGQAAASGSVGHFRIYGSDGTCHVQGMLDGVVLTKGQTVTFTGFTLTDNNA